MTPSSLFHLRDRIRNACTRCHRSFDDISIVAASKTQNPESIRFFYENGILDFGENYVQELVSKQKILGDTEIHWHYIGHLQRNKVKYIAPFIKMIHSVDSLALAEEISRQAQKHQRCIDILLQVNTSGEASKSGISPHEVFSLAEECSRLSHLQVCGLMTLPAPQEKPEAVRPEFRHLRHLRDHLHNEKGITSCVHLSMGMSDDFEVAIEEGATLIRPGSLLFGERTPQTAVFTPPLPE